jgi:N-acetyl-S-(2-succino)cysteine monooxygenase
MPTARKMILSMFLSNDCNYHLGGWRHPDATSDPAFDIHPWIEFAHTLERGKIDILFVGDSSGVAGIDDPEEFTRSPRYIGFEPFTLVSAIAMATKHIGLALTASTTWYEPYTVARLLASLDRISAGRAGWNVVTGRNPEAAQNYNLTEHIEHDRRYERAEEFVDVCFGLWESFDADAFVRDRESGRYIHPDRYRVLGHKGSHFAVKGPLNVPRPIQGRPLIIQAGQSGPGMDLAARVADCVFTAQPNADAGRRFYQDIKGRAARFGRSADSIKVLPGVTFYCGRTQDEARRKLDDLQALMPATMAIKALGSTLGQDLSAFPAEGPIPPLKPNKTFADPELLARGAREQGLNFGQFAVTIATSRSHNMLVGTPTEICDELERWFLGGACDGFNIISPMVPGSLNDFVDMIVPELQRRGLFKSEYAGTTLRENLGLPLV